MVVEEVAKPVNANLSIFIARLGNEDIICMLNASLLGIWEAPMRSLLEIINNQLLLIWIKLLLLAWWYQFWRMTPNMCWKCWSCNAKLAGNGILGWWWFLVLSAQILLRSLLKVIFLLLKCLLWPYSWWNWPWNAYQVVIRVLRDNLDSLIAGS